MQTNKGSGLLADPTVSLRDYQRKGVRLIHKYVRRNGGCMLGDEQGLGKTPQALVWLRKEKDALPAIIVAPSAACLVWERECRKWCTDSVVVAEKPGDLDYSQHDVVIISYDALSREIERLLRRKFNSLLMDEVHFLASRTSLRFRLIQRLALNQRRGRIGKRKEIAFIPRIKYRVGISGTPMPNRNIDLWTVLSILWPYSFPSFWDFAWEYSRPFRPRGRGYWIFSGSKNIEKLRGELKRHGLIRRMKADHLDIPKKNRKIRLVKLKDYSEYLKADKNFIKWLTKLNKHKAKRAAKMETFSKITYLLRLTAKEKAKQVARWIDWHQQSGEKLVVFSFVKPLLKALEDRHGSKSVRIDGDVRGRERMALVDRFQNDPTCTLALCNGKAAGVSLTLHAAHWCLITDLPWNPSLLWQMEDRIHRFGQKEKTKFVYLVAVGTMEERVMEVLKSKQKIIEKVMNKKNHRFDSGDLAKMSKSMTSELVKSIISK
jgi:SNF2 family DNA or RNA helicase